MAAIVANIARPAGAKALTGFRPAGASRVRARAPLRVSASSAVAPRLAPMGDSLAVAAAVAGANAASRGLGAKPSVGAKLGDWFRTQQEAGKDLVAKIDFQDATVIAVIGAVMSYKEKKMVALITQAVGSFIKFYLLMLFVRVLLTWFPNVDWMRQPWAILRQVTDPYLNLFRNLIPPIMGQIDFTPILGFMVLQFLAKVLSSDPSVGRF
uniref:Fanciful K+ uptake-b family transporter n=1 Tax=Micromonas pusilla TaxID=38833 RepID=A0A7S0KRR8_MICPS